MTFDDVLEQRPATVPLAEVLGLQHHLGGGVAGEGEAGAAL